MSTGLKVAAAFGAGVAVGYWLLKSAKARIGTSDLVDSPAPRGPTDAAPSDTAATCEGGAARAPGCLFV